MLAYATSPNSYPLKLWCLLLAVDSLNLTSTNVKDEISAPDTVIPNILSTGSHIDEELGIPSSNVSSVKSEYETFDQEVAKSMMTVLLPRALPLLKTFSRRPANSVKPPEKSTHMAQEENKTDLHATVTCGMLTSAL